MIWYTWYGQFRIMGCKSIFYQYSITYCCLFNMTKASWAPAAWSWFSNVVLFVNYCKPTRYKYSITASSKFCSIFINSRLNALYLVFWTSEVRVRYRRRKRFTKILYTGRISNVLALGDKYPQWAWSRSRDPFIKFGPQSYRWNRWSYSFLISCADYWLLISACTID